MPKLTIRSIQAARPRPEGDVFLWDADMPRFGLRVKPSGTKSYLVQYRVGRRTRRITFGTFPTMRPEEARKRARALLVAVDHERDPSAERRAKAKGETVADLCWRFLDEYAPRRKRASSMAEDRRLITLHALPALGAFKAADVTRADVLKLHDRLRGTPYQANRVLALVSKLFNLAEAWGLRPEGANPCRHVERFPEAKRERFLSADELARLGDALAAVEREATEAPEAVAAIRLLVLTGCRRNEILALAWEHVDFERRCLRLAESKTGTKTVHLNAPALEVLAALAGERKDEHPYVIPGGKAGEHLADLERPWQRIRARVGLDDVRLHDLRHSFASVAAGLGEGLPMIGKLLGHTQAQTTHRYAHLAADPVKAATEKVGAALAGAMAGRSAQVVPLASAGRGARRREEGR